MVTGIYPVSRASLLDRELRAQTGTTLENWASDRGISFFQLEDALNGERSDLDSALAELAATLGVSVSVLQETGT